MAIEFKIKHGIVLALSLAIVLLIGCISLVSLVMHQSMVNQATNQGNDGPKQALKSSVQDSSTTLPEKVTDSTSTFNTTEDVTKDNTTETPFQEDSSTTLPQNMTDSTTFFNTTEDDVTKDTSETPFQEDSTTLLEKVTDYFTTFSTLLKTLLRLLGV